VEPQPGLRLCLFGAAPDTGNLGVSALGAATIAAVARNSPSADVTLFDHGQGERPGRVRLSSEEEFRHRLRGGYHTLRLHRPESLWQIRAAGWLGALGEIVNGGARAIARADAVLDISGGDSFSDIYGPRRFRSICLGKLAALEVGTPLVLLPQTYGPFRSESALRQAGEIARGAAVAWARDARSFESLAELLGDDLDPSRHRSGVDVAFGLPAILPERLPEGLEEWLGERGKGPLAGLNVSGLIHESDSARGAYGLADDYAKVIGAVARRLLAEGARVVLIPHVIGGAECDAAACRRVLAELGDEGRGRVLSLAGDYDASGAKGIISRLDFFCGTRMHSCIAALSSGVPAAGLAYSKKTLGVFETCGQGDAVPDLRRETAPEIAERVQTLWRERGTRRSALAATVPAVVAASGAQMQSILAAVSEGRERRPRRRRP